MNFEVLRVYRDDIRDKLFKVSDRVRSVVLIIESEQPDGNYDFIEEFPSPVILVLKSSVTLELVTKSHLCFAASDARIGSFTAEEALKEGLINQVFPREDLEREVLKIAEQISSFAPIALRSILKAVIEGEKLSLHEGLGLEAKLFARIFATKDAKEGISAFLQKRKPHFQGE